MYLNTKTTISYLAISHTRKPAGFCCPQEPGEHQSGVISLEGRREPSHPRPFIRSCTVWIKGLVVPADSLKGLRGLQRNGSCGTVHVRTSHESIRVRVCVEEWNWNIEETQVNLPLKRWAEEEAKRTGLCGR